MAKFSQYDNYQKVGDKDLEYFLEAIKMCLYKEEVEVVRTLHFKGDADAAENLIREFPAFTPSGTFGDSRNNNSLLVYSNLIILDFDNVEELEVVFSKIMNLPYTLVAFRSAKGEGIKVLIKVNSDSYNHQNAYDQVAEYYSSHLGIPLDTSCIDIASLCFLSSDATLHHDEDAKVFEVKIDEKSITTRGYINFSKSSLLYSGNQFVKGIDICIDITSIYDEYKGENRDNYIFKLACRCNRIGIPNEHLKSYLPEKFDLDKEELENVIESAYEIDEFARDSFFAIYHFLKNKFEPSNSPTLPKEVYDLLPPLLKKATNVFPEVRQKDMFFLTALAVLSGCLNEYEGLYDSKSVYPNLYCFIVAPAASGKGVTEYAKIMGEAYNKHLIDKSKKEYREYLQALAEYEVKKSTPEGECMDLVRPIETTKKILYMPANSSSAAFVEKMLGSDGRVILFETEADTLSNTLKKEWGGYSELLRCSFHHETVSVNRKGSDGLIEINRPRLSVAISGTPSQVVSLIQSAENGLFSRFIYYTFWETTEWKDVSPNNEIPDKGLYFEELSKEVLEMVKFFDENPSSFSLKSEQWDEINKQYSLLIDYYGLISNINSDISSIITRSGLIRFRICMILSAVRRFETKDKSKHLICSQEDFEVAGKIADVLVIHSLIIMNQLPKRTEVLISNGEDTFYKDLPIEFNRSEAIKQGESVGIKPRTSDGHLRRLVEKGKLKKLAMGRYAKI